MNMWRSLSFAAGGVVAGVFFILSCGDDGPGAADAADPGCDCPASEPPVTRARLSEKQLDIAIPAGQTVELGLGCDAPSMFWAGGCDVTGTAPVDSVLSKSFPASTDGWICEWRNLGANEDTGIVRVVCLDPPQ